MKKIIEIGLLTFAMVVICISSASAQAYTIVNSFDLSGVTDSYTEGIVWDGDSLWLNQGGTLYDVAPYTVDGTTAGDILSTLDVTFSLYTHGIAWDGTNFWLDGHFNDPNIYEVDTSGNLVSTTLGPEPGTMGITYDGTNLWTVHKNYDVVNKVNTDTGFVSSFQSPAARPHGMGWDGSYLWTTTIGTGANGYDQIWQLDRTGTVMHSFEFTTDYVEDIDYADGSLWVTTFYSKVYQLSVPGAAVVPEPISSILFLIGAAALGFRRFRNSITN